jgi:hypothetical protein
MFKKILLTSAILLLAGLAFSQSTQTGNIVGRVISPEGEGLPGVSVTITSPAMIISVNRHGENGAAPPWPRAITR